MRPPRSRGAMVFSELNGTILAKYIGNVSLIRLKQPVSARPRAAVKRVKVSRCASTVETNDVGARRVSAAGQPGNVTVLVCDRMRVGPVFDDNGIN